MLLLLILDEKITKEFLSYIVYPGNGGGAIFVFASSGWD